MISTVDPEARHAHKTRARHEDGYKAHVKVEPDTGLITGCALTPAAGPEHSDAAVGIERLADEPRPDPGTGRFGLRHRRAARRGRRRGAHRDHQAVAAAPGRAVDLLAGRRSQPAAAVRRRSAQRPVAAHRVAALNLRRLLALGLTRSGGS